MGTGTSAATFRAIDLATDIEAIVELLTDVNRHDQPGWFPSVASLSNDWSPTGTFKPDRDLQGLDLDGRLIGIARHTWRERPAVVNHRLEVYVDPEFRRQGHGGRLLDWAQARARAAVAQGEGGPADKPQQFGGGGRDTEPFREFAAAKGFEPYRYHHEMRRPLSDPIRDAPLPDGLEVRPVLPEHHRAIWNADEESFRDHWDHAEPVEGDFERFFNDPNIDTSMWQVAWDGDEVAGSVVNGIYPHENKELGLEIGWLDHVSVRRPWRGRGLASSLIARSMTILRDKGMAIAALGVDAENPTGALGLYEKLGFVPYLRWVNCRKPLD